MHFRAAFGSVLAGDLRNAILSVGWRRLLTIAFLCVQNLRVSEKTVKSYLVFPFGKWLAGSDWLTSKWPMQYCYASRKGSYCSAARRAFVI